MNPLPLLSTAWRLVTSPIGKLVLIGLFAAGLWWRGSHYRNERDELQAWQDDVVLSTRDAAHRPKLAVRNVAQQVRYLGQGLDTIRTAMDAAKSKALADKLVIDTENERKRKDADDDLRKDAIEDRRRADAYKRAYRVPRGGRKTNVGGGDDGGNHLPEPAFAAGQPDGPGQPPAVDDGYVVVTSDAFDLCTVNTRRLENAHEWAVDKLPKTSD